MVLFFYVGELILMMEIKITMVAICGVILQLWADERRGEEEEEEEEGVTLVLPSATNLAMGFPVRLNSILLGALITLPLLLPMLPEEVLLDPSEVPKSPRGVMVHAGHFWAYVHLLPHLLVACLLLQPPWQVVAPSVELQQDLDLDLDLERLKRIDGLRRGGKQQMLSIVDEKKQ
ncbi:hypothetical protein ACMD2_04491 [Ananas comosus]|uniref:Uncharacterized protein n=1 Tax=Ananas comosus TaxID=4615 RepID=A0A199VPQ8_ANACO|nr:hypothetical protein ACMD2_04491 [Ananas comosus]